MIKSYFSFLINNKYFFRLILFNLLFHILPIVLQPHPLSENSGSQLVCGNEGEISPFHTPANWSANFVSGTFAITTSSLSKVGDLTSQVFLINRSHSSLHYVQSIDLNSVGICFSQSNRGPPVV